MVTIHLGGESANALDLTIWDRAHPWATDFWDGNWLTGTAEVSAGAFHGSVGGAIRADEMAAFRQQLETLYERLDGEAWLRTMEHWVQLRVTASRQGHVEVTGRLLDDPVNGNALEFRLHFDQTYLPPVIRQLRAVAEQFPLLGEGPSPA